MRTAFIQQLILEARRNPRVFLVVGDLGYSVVEPFADEFPERFLNAGVAEQNMTGVAAGLASEGFHVFTYSIANFSTLRCLEQIRNDVCHHDLPVTIVAVGGGLAYGNLGYSHHAVQDIAIMRTMPRIQILAPADPGETRECVSWLAKHPGPSYLRVGKAGEKQLHDVQGIDRGPLRVRSHPSARIALASAGGILDEALLAADILFAEGQFVNVFSVPWLKPLTAERLDCLASHDAIVAIEEHVAEAGFASALREHLPLGPPVFSISLNEAAGDVAGSQSYLRRVADISSSRIVQTCRSLLSQTRPQ